MAKIFHAHLRGNRDAKYDRLMESNISDTAWTELLPQMPFYLLTPQNNQLLTEYEQFWKITDISPQNLLGFQTHRDSVAVAHTEEDLMQQVRHYLGREPDANLWTRYCKEIDYRPFDSRFAYLAKEVTDRPRLDVTAHLFYSNLAFNLVRQTRAIEWNHAIVSDKPTPAIFVEVKDGSSIFPLYLYSPNVDFTGSKSKFSRRPNLSQPFLNDITAKLGYTPTPEAIFYYIYAIFHSPTYRIRYAEFLKIDFPRVPLTRNDTRFRQLAAYGEELVALHLMKSARLEQKSQLPQFVEQGGKGVVEPAHPKYEAKTRSVVINKKGDHFIGVPEAVWNFYVGGYPVCAKWLKDRKGRTLTQADITHYQRIVVALQETMRLMQQIDEAIPGFPIV